MSENINSALNAEKEYKTNLENAYDYVENFDILETITNVGNDEVFTPKKICDSMLDSLPDEVWHNPNYKWLNPATKNGIFEREIAIRLNEGLKDIITDEEKRKKHILQDMIYAIGQTKFTANVARRTLYYCSQANKKCDGIKAKDGHYVNGYAIGNGSWFSDEEGNIKTPVSVHSFGEKGKCIYCGVSKDSRYVDDKQREQYAYEFIHHHHLKLEKSLKNLFLKGDENMKFDIIIGNPPYQLQVNQSGKGLGAVPIYQKFVQQAILLNPKYLCMIIPSRWFSGGVGLEDFRKQMLNDNHIKILVDYSDSNDCFPTTDINGGVCYFLRDLSYYGDCKFTNITNGISDSQIRKLNEYEFFIRKNDSLSILNKVLKFKEKKISNGGCSPQTPYGFLSTFVGNKDKINKDDCKILTSKGWAYVERKKVLKSVDTIDLYKPMISKLSCEHAGNPDKNGMYRVLSRMEILKPSEICSQSYLTICPNKNEKIAENVSTYLKTKFVRYLILLTLVGMNISIDNFKFVPWLDFSIEWTDEKLYKKYNLTKEDIKTIENITREMN